MLQPPLAPLALQPPFRTNAQLAQKTNSFFFVEENFGSLLFHCTVSRMVRLAAVAELFDECQQSYASHRKALMLMNRMHQQHTEEFRAHFMTCLEPILLVFKREPAVERLVKFVCDLASCWCSGRSN